MPPRSTARRWAVRRRRSVAVLLGSRRAGRRDRRHARRLGRARYRLVRPDHEHRARRDRSRRHDNGADGAHGQAGVDRVGRRHGARLELRPPPDGGERSLRRRRARRSRRRPHVREPRGDAFDDVGLEVRVRLGQLLRVPGAAALRDAPEARRLRHREPGEQPRVRLRGDGRSADAGRARAARRRAGRVRPARSPS